MSPGRTGTTMPTVPTIVAVITRQPPTAFGSGGSQEGRVGDRLSDSALVHGSGARDLGESFRLVADVESLVLQRREVLPTVVRAEEQLSAGNEAGADVGLGPTSVAAVSSSQFGCQCCRHRVRLFPPSGVPRRETLPCTSDTRSVHPVDLSCLADVPTVNHVECFPRIRLGG